MSKLSQGAAAAIEGINKAGSAVDSTLKSARRKGACYPEMKALLQAMSQAARALQTLGQAPSVENATGAHHALASVANDRWLRDCNDVRDNCATDMNQIRLWQVDQIKLLSGSASHLLRRSTDFALQRSGKLHFKGLALAYLAGTVVLFTLGFSGQQTLSMALAFPLTGWGLALFADQQITRSTDAIVARAAKRISDAEQRRDTAILQITRNRDAMLGQIADELKQRLAKIAQITDQANSMLEQRAKDADQVITAWTQQIRADFSRVEQSNGVAAPPDLLELGTLKCKLR